MNNIKSTLEGHLKFFADVASGQNYDVITEWVRKNLVNESSIEKANINSFFCAEKEFIKGCIGTGNFNQVKHITDAVDSIQFKPDNLKKYEQLKRCQCKVLEDIIKVTKDSTMRNNLNGLLDSRKSELQTLNKELSTSIVSPNIEPSSHPCHSKNLS